MNLYDLLDVRTLRATPRSLEPDYLMPIEGDGIRPADASDPWLWHRMYRKGRPTESDPTDGRDATWGDNRPQFPNWPNFGIVYRHALEVRNDCHLPRRLHVHVHRPALVSVGDGASTGAWDRPMPCNVATSNGLVYRLEDGSWQSARLGACRRDNVSRDDADVYPAEERGGLLRIGTLDVPAGETATLDYELMLTPPSTQNLVHAITLDPIQRVKVPACATTHAYAPFEGRHRWSTWSEDLDAADPFDYVLDAVESPATLSADGSRIEFTPTEPGRFHILEYSYHDEGVTPLHEKCDASCPVADASACAGRDDEDDCRRKCERERELCGPDARCVDGNCKTGDDLHVYEESPLNVVSEGRGILQVEVDGCPPGSEWSPASGQCEQAPPPFSGSACPSVGKEVDWSALRTEAASIHDASSLRMSVEIPYDPGNTCGPITYELPVPCDGYQDYAAWRLGGAVATFRVGPGLPSLANNWVHNPGYYAEGMMDPTYAHPAKDVVVSCRGGGGSMCSFGSYGDGLDDTGLAPCNAARMDATPGPAQPGPGAYGGAIRAFPVHRRDAPAPSYPAGYRECYDRIHLSAQGGGTPVACQTGDGLEHGSIFLLFQPAAKPVCE